MDSLSTCLRSARGKTKIISARVAVLFVFLGTFTISTMSQETQSSNTGSSTELGVTAMRSSAEIEPSTRIETTKKIKKHRWDKTFWSVWIPAIALGIADVGLTQACLRHPNCREGNPLFGSRPSPWIYYSAKAGGLGLAFVISRNQRSHGSKSWLLFPIMALGEGSAATINNSIVLSRSPSLSTKFKARSVALPYLSSSSGGWTCQSCVKTPRVNFGIESLNKLNLTGPSVSPKLTYELIPHGTR
jgi:hypothetical protein